MEVKTKLRVKERRGCSYFNIFSSFYSVIINLSGGGGGCVLSYALPRCSAPTLACEPRNIAAALFLKQNDIKFMTELNRKLNWIYLQHIKKKKIYKTCFRFAYEMDTDTKTSKKL